MATQVTITTTNRFPDLVKNVKDALSSERVADIAGEAIRPAAEEYIRIARNLAPEGTSEPGYGYPSLRLWRKRFGDSIEGPEMAEPEQGEGIVAKVLLNHPSVGNPGYRGDIADWLIHGTPPHTIQGHGKKLRFHWGSPLPWRPRDGAPPGVRVRESVGSSHVYQRGHWAGPGYDFLEGAARTTEQLFEEARDRAAGEVLFDGLADSEFLNRV